MPCVAAAYSPRFASFPGEGGLRLCRLGSLLHALLLLRKKDGRKREDKK